MEMGKERNYLFMNCMFAQRKVQQINRMNM